MRGSLGIPGALGKSVPYASLTCLICKKKKIVSPNAVQVI